jgi:hypothetical protein
MTYTMKDLGYTRTPTDAMYQVEMPDGSLWQVPVQVIADSRDENYVEDQEDTIGYIRTCSLSEFEITDWAGNNMNWSDVKQYAVEVPRPKRKVDWEEGWVNGEKEIVGKL